MDTNIRNAASRRRTPILETVTGERIKLERGAGFHLEFVTPCGPDLIAQLRITDVQASGNNRAVRVYVSTHPTVALLVDLAHARGQLKCYGPN